MRQDVTFPSCPFCNGSLRETLGEGDWIDQYCSHCKQRVPVNLLTARDLALRPKSNKLDSPDSAGLAIRTSLTDA